MKPRAGTTGDTGRRHTRSSGQALVELALVAPIILLLLMGLVQFAIIYERQIGIENAVRDAARRAATWETKDVATASTNATAALAVTQSLLGNSQTHDGSLDTIEVCYFTPTTYAQDASGQYQVMVRIKESYRHPLFLPIITQILDGIDGVNDNALKASTQTQFRVEQSDTAGVGYNLGAGAYARNYADATACQQ